MEAANKPQKLERVVCKVEDFRQFKLTEKRFDHQYASIYAARLAALKERLLQKAKLKWDSREVIQLSDLVDKSEDDLFIIVGTLYKHQELKPSILRELSEELQLIPQPSRSNYASFKDALFLEDENLRVKLIGENTKTQTLVTGLVCALLGHALEDGTFLVKEWCFPGCPINPRMELLNDEGKILLICGLDIANTPKTLSLHLFFEWITGMIGNENSQHEQASVTCVIIAGNSVRAAIEAYNHKCYFESKSHDEVMFKKSAMAVHRLDNFLSSIVRSCPVILMPGEFDPVGHVIPQQPFHSCMLPHCSRYRNIYGVTNPWTGRINSRIVAGSCGQPIKDIMKVAGLASKSALTWLEHTLQWGHYVPTAPDTLPAYPYFSSDPFIIAECPDIYFTSNMGEYDSKMFQVEEGHPVRLICVPEFSKTQMGVLVNLQDLRTWPIRFC